jgi:hypothetical protein
MALHHGERRPGRVARALRAVLRASTSKGAVAVLAKHARTGGTALLLAHRATSDVMTARRRLAATAYLGTLIDATALGTKRA